MVVRSAPEVPSFVPTDRPRITVAPDGSLAAIAEPARVVVVELPGGIPIAEIGVASEAVATEVAWVGSPPRLLALSRYGAHSTVHLLDAQGPRTIAEIRLESPMRLYATVGGHALAVGSLGAAVLTASETHLTPYQFPARTVPVAAGAAAGQFVVALPGSIEEWDPQNRMPKRRLRLPRPAVITAVGGSDRVVWMTTQQDPRRIDVIPLVNRGQPKAHDLPEPIAFACGHPRSDLVACIGAESGRLYVIDLDGRTKMRLPIIEGIDRVDAVGLVVGRSVGVLVAQANRPVVVVPLDARDPEPAGSDLAGRAAEVRTRPTLIGDEPEATPASEKPPARVAAPLGFTASNAPGRVMASPARTTTPPARMPSRPSALPPLPASEPQHGWRDEVVGWARAVAAGLVEHHPPASPPIDALVARFELPAQLTPALVLLYGAHLAGEDGAAPVDVARVLGRRWDEALGRGQLASAGLAIHARSRVRLAAPILALLDELPAQTGTLVGEPGTIALLGPCVLVDPDGPLAAIAERHLSRAGGAILAAHPGAALGDLFVEARARGAAPMVHVTSPFEPVPTELAMFVVDDDALADQLGVPRLF